MFYAIIITMMLQHILSIRNSLDYQLRQFIKWRRSGLLLKNEAKDRVFADLKPEDRIKACEIEKRLVKDYDLQDLVERSDLENYKTNLYYLEMLEHALDALNVELPAHINAADIGCSSWFYVRGLAAGLYGWRSEKARQVHLWGFEIDAYRPYFDLHSRYDYAQAFCQNLKDVTFCPFEFSVQPEKFDLIGQFFPFIFINDHLSWGLPGDQYDPVQLFQKAWLSLKKGGVFVVVNQGRAEHEEQKKMFKSLGEIPEVAFQVKSVFKNYEKEHYLTGVVKRG